MTTVQVKQGSIETQAYDTLIVNLFEGVTSPGGATGAVDRALGGAISELIAQGDLSGKLAETTVLYPRGAIAAKRVIVVGLGEPKAFGLEQLRQAAAAAVRRAKALKATQVATIVHGAGIGGLAVQAAAQATAEGMLLALYHYQAPKQHESAHQLAQLTIIEYDADKLPLIQAGVTTAEALAQGVTLARDLVNMPPNVKTPSKLAEVALEMAAAHGLGVTVGDRDWAQEQGMGAFLAVAQGAGHEPKFIVLEHNGSRSELETIVLVGKGITFDTGGISIKPSAGMEAMKSDMAGAAAVLGAMKVAALLALPLRLIGIIPATENKPDAHALRPSDVIRASNGKTIEIISTDAEGRLVLADALVYAERYNPAAVIDLATLTGACVVALGEDTAAGLFSNDDALAEALLASGASTHERLWRLPLWQDYLERIKSEVADLKNSGGRMGGVATSAVFLQAFTNYPWAHLDIAGVALSSKGHAYAEKGATGFGVRLLSAFLHARL
jgi:leucyl aminopeptidase